MTKADKIGAPRKSLANIPAGAHRLLAGEWKKICRGLVKVEGGPEFLALPLAQRNDFFRHLAVIATSSWRKESSEAQLAALKKMGVADTRRSQLNRILWRWLSACDTSFPHVTAFALPRLVARVQTANDLGRDYWMSRLGHISESDGSGKKMSQKACDGLTYLRKLNREDAAMAALSSASIGGVLNCYERGRRATKEV